MEKNTSEQEHIGFLIKELRTQRGLTQQQFADMMETSQSAVARMEKGGQNFSMKELTKISEILGHPIVSISHNDTDDFHIEGGRTLSGSIQTNCSKNGGLGLICAALLNKGKTILHGIPRIEEISRMLEVFESLNIKITWTDDNTLEIVPPAQYDFSIINRASASKMRSVIMLMGSMVHHLKQFRIPHAGGCQMGERTMGAHQYGLEDLGITITTEENDYFVDASKMKAGEVTMYESSDTGTENILIAAALIPETSYIHFAQENYMVQDVMGFLKLCGVRFERVSVATLAVTGVSEINTTLEYWNSEDPIESMAFLTAGIITRSTITVTRCPIDFLRLELLKLRHMGLKYTVSDEYFSQNGFTKLVDITVMPSELVALPDKIHALPYPGINIDNLPFFVPIAVLAKGSTLIHDWSWENRAIYFTELNRLGANIKLADPHRVFIEGPTPLRSAQIVCPPALRPSMIILLAMLAAPGSSILRNVYSIKRGYENIAERLNSIGANIQHIQRP